MLLLNVMYSICSSQTYHRLTAASLMENQLFMLGQTCPRMYKLLIHRSSSTDFESVTLEPMRYQPRLNSDVSLIYLISTYDLYSHYTCRKYVVLFCLFQDQLRQVGPQGLLTLSPTANFAKRNAWSTSWQYLLYIRADLFTTFVHFSTKSSRWFKDKLEEFFILYFIVSESYINSTF